MGYTYIVSTQRKTWYYPRWEEAMFLTQSPSISPLHLLKTYVALTSDHAKTNELVLRALHRPFKPLTADKIAPITKALLTEMGVPMHLWGAHSTRGAGVLFYKKLGLSLEEVCEIGQWKNTQAFTSHYLRLGAPAKAAQQVQNFVHTVSFGQRAEHERSHSPSKKLEGGRSDLECGAQRPNEPDPPSRKRERDKSQSPPGSSNLHCRKTANSRPPKQ